VVILVTEQRVFAVTIRAEEVLRVPVSQETIHYIAFYIHSRAGNIGIAAPFVWIVACEAGDLTDRGGFPLGVEYRPVDFLFLSFAHPSRIVGNHSIWVA
jgi:hypothetical protein